MISLASSASAQEPAGLRAVMHQRVAVQVSPTGVEHAAALALRTRIGDPSELLYTGAHAELGVSNYTSPIYSMTGAYLEVTPLAFLSLRAEILGVGMWPIGLSGAGYYPLGAYDAQLEGDSLAANQGQQAAGWDVQLSAVLQGALPMGPLRLLFWNQLTAERIELGAAPYFYYPKIDAVLAREDWILDEHAMLLAEGALDSRLTLRAGFYDELRLVPRSEDLANQTGIIAALVIANADPAVPEIMPFVRAGVYTNHERRAGEVTALAGVFVHYELGALR